MGITLNQLNFLSKNGINAEGWTYEQASAKISELKSVKYQPKTTYPKQVEFVNAPQHFEQKPYVAPVKEKFEAHLSIEQVRTNALTIALGLTAIPNDERVLLDVADNIVHWMLTGLRKEVVKQDNNVK